MNRQHAAIAKIETLEQSIAALLRERSARATKDFQPAVRPMYRVHDSKGERDLSHAGICVLLKVDGHPVLSTAAHILDRQIHGELLAVGGPGGTNPVPLRHGVIRTTTAPSGNRDLDRYDCGFWIMPDNAVRHRLRSRHRIVECRQNCADCTATIGVGRTSA